MQVSADHNYEVGDVLVFETGEYSDYTFTGPFRVTKAFQRSTAASSFNAQWQPSWDGHEPEGDDFIAWLSREGFIEEIPHTSWHVGSYGRFEP